MSLRIAIAWSCLVLGCSSPASRPPSTVTSMPRDQEPSPAQALASPSTEAGATRALTPQDLPLPAPLQTWSRDAQCPAGAALEGARPPDGQALYCRRPDDTRHGPHASFWPSGALAAAGSFVDGQRDGTWTQWLESGAIAEQAQYERGQMHGVAARWHARTGALATLGSYEHGLMHGTFQQWSESGALLGSFVMERGNGVFTVWHDDGGKALEGAYVDGKKDGDWQQWAASGALLGTYTMHHGTGVERTWLARRLLGAEMTYEDGALHGPVRGWHLDGTQAMTGQHVRGQRDGTWIYFDAQGAPRHREIYRDGALIRTESP
jgi:antitoxin component YwqK of YwqJK toxin-antitoxin module